jgi:hypothetical protein
LPPSVCPDSAALGRGARARLGLASAGMVASACEASTGWRAGSGVGAAAPSAGDALGDGEGSGVLGA